MKTLHCRVQAGKRGRAKKNVRYILRVGPYRPRTQIAGAIRARFADLMASGFGNLPRWADADPIVFFAVSDAQERKNGTSFRAVHFALPRGELAMQIAIVERICRRLFQESRRHAFVWAIHNPKAAFEGGDQPHAHVTFCERLIDERVLEPTRYFSRFNRSNAERGGYLKFGWELTPSQRSDHLIRIRETIAEEINRALEECGLPHRISHLSNAQRGIKRDAERFYRGRGSNISAAVLSTRRLRERIGLLEERLVDDRRSLAAWPSIRQLAQRRRDRQRMKLLAAHEAHPSPDGILAQVETLAQHVVDTDRSQDRSETKTRTRLELEQMFGMLRPGRAERISREEADAADRDDLEPGEHED
jgi:hypothetical protein